MLENNGPKIPYHLPEDLETSGTHWKVIALFSIAACIVLASLVFFLMWGDILNTPQCLFRECPAEPSGTESEAVATEGSDLEERFASIRERLPESELTEEERAALLAQMERNASNTPEGTRALTEAEKLERLNSIGE